jgi:hypothetical protein
MNSPRAEDLAILRRYLPDFDASPAEIVSETDTEATHER